MAKIKRKTEVGIRVVKSNTKGKFAQKYKPRPFNKEAHDSFVTNIFSIIEQDITYERKVVFTQNNQECVH